MGLLQEGRWVDQWYNTKESEGQFVRASPQFRNWITSDGSAGPSGDAGFKAEADRYHLYVSLACPWAHRTLIFRELKGLQNIIPISVVHWHMAENGWTFENGEGVVQDTVYGVENLHQLYTFLPMQLNNEEKAMLAGDFGPAVKWAIEHQLQVGRMFDAKDMVAVSPVSYTHLTLPTKA